MKLGLSTCTYTWNFGVTNYPQPSHPFTLDVLFDKAFKHHIPVVQILDNIVPLHLFSDSALYDIRKSADAHCLQLEIGTRGITPHILKQYLHIAEITGSTLVRTIMDGDGAHPSVPEGISWIEEVLPSYEAAGISLAIENHDLRHVAELKELTETIDSPYLGTCIDCVNSLGIQECQAQVIEALLPQAINFHYKDFTIRRTDYDMGFIVQGCIAGQGMTDMDYMIKNRNHSKKNFNLILEQWMPWLGTIEETTASEEQWAEESIHYLQNKFKSLFSN